MKNFFFRHGKEIVFAGLIILCMTFAANIIMQGKSYTSGMENEAVEKAALLSAEEVRVAQSRADRLKTEAEVTAATLATFNTEEEVINFLSNFRISGGEDRRYYLDAWFCKDGVYYRSGVESECTYPEIEAALRQSGTTLSRVFPYRDNRMTVAVSADCDGYLTDRVTLLYDRSAVTDFIYSDPEKRELNHCFRKSAFALVCKHDGTILERVVQDDSFQIGAGTVTESVLPMLLSDESYESILQTLGNGADGSFVVRIGTEKYVLTVNNLGADSGNITLVNLYKMKEIYGSGYELVDTIWATLLIFFVILGALCLYFIVDRLRVHRRIFEIGTVDPQLNCPNMRKFEEDLSVLLSQNKVTRFAVVLLRISNFAYIPEHFGEPMARRLLKYTRNLCQRALLMREAYAYSTDGEFALLLHYKNRDALMSRLSALRFSFDRFSGFGQSGYKAKLVFDIYEIDRTTPQKPHRIIEKAMAIRDMPAEEGGGLTDFRFYSDVVRETYLKRAEIEGRMEEALKKSEFHLFYQPKYSFKKQGIDGSEVLVRWFDARKNAYRSPDLFLPVFEENGFIVKLDHFVFYKACENAAFCVQNGLEQYPLSINVSRFTAIQPDFLSYYTRVKKKFGVKDGFITLEFTESFAYENYEYLSDMITALHAAGFYCSLDDFGTGYSSYNILKELEMDEIKLDKFFIRKGINAERDRIILENTIKVIRQLGMKVTQEGVESQEDFERLQALGCDVIQGYYFAKPMKFVQYCEFVRKKASSPSAWEKE